jgi:molybdate transport system regulatory protein
MDEPNLFLRIDFAEGSRLGPGKIALLEVISRTGSIAAAARELGMGYRTAWLLIDSLNSMFVEPVVTTLPGRRDGGSEVTDFGKEVIGSFHRMEDLSRAAIRNEIATLRRKLK